MEKIYIVKNESFAYLTMSFKNQKDAEKYCQLANDMDVNGNGRYIVSQVDCFSSIQEIKNDKKNNVEEKLKTAIISLEKRIEKIRDNTKKFRVDFKAGYSVLFDMGDFEGILNIKENCISAEDKKDKTEWWRRTLKGDDLLLLKNKYENLKEDLFGMEKRLKTYKKEYAIITNKKNETKTKNDDLTK